MSYPILSIRSLSKSFGTVPALSGVDLDVCAGEMLGVVGPPGGGKSTLLLCAAGILKPSFGSVVVLGRRITSAQDFFDVVYVPPRPVYYSFLTVRDALSCYSAKPTTPGRMIRSVDSSIDRMMLSDNAEQRVGSLDAGKVLCVALAQAIVARPRVLLLDAPLDQMDRPNARIARAAVLRAAEAVAAVIITSRDPVHISGVSTRNVFLNDGKLSLPETTAASSPLERIASRVAETHH
jgi:ABC-type multidrug transport system ATPase subunit